MGTTLTGKSINDTYDGLLKTTDNQPLTSQLKEITDGLGNDSGVFMDQNGNLKAEGILEFGQLKDTGENIVIDKFVDEADGIAANPDDRSIPTSAAVKGYADTKVSKSGDTVTGNLDVDGTLRGEQYFYVRDTGGTNVFGVRSESSYATIDIGNRTLNYASNVHKFLDSSFAEKVRFTNANTYFGVPIRIGANAAANEFDDYEEGTYNIEFELFRQNSSDQETIGSSGFSNWNNRSTYTKIGNRVTINVDLEYRNGSSTKWSSSMYYVGLTNLPFTPETAGTGLAYTVGGTFYMDSFYQDFQTGNMFMSIPGSTGNYGQYITLGGKLSSAYPDYAQLPMVANEMPQYRNFSNANNVRLMGVLHYKTS